MKDAAPRPRVSKLIIMGDSLSDAGAMNNKPIMRYLGEVDKSPEGRFTNGMVWSDYLLEQLGQKSPNDAGKPDVDWRHHKKKLIAGEKIARSYALGGSTAHSTSSSEAIKYKVIRVALSSLGKQREELLTDNKKYVVSNEEIKNTLVAEWSGANDLATVHDLQNGDVAFAKTQAKMAVMARLENIEQLIRAGYKKFALFTLPDMANTPRFNSKKTTSEQREQIRELCNEFNQNLQLGIASLAEKYIDQDCSIKCFDVNEEFNEIYHNPERYGFNADTTLQANNVKYVKDESIYIDEDIQTADTDQIIQDRRGSGAPLFNDDVHPSTQAHELIAKSFQEFCEQNFTIQFGKDSKLQDKNAEDLVELFRSAYESKLGRTNKVRGFFQKGKMDEILATKTNAEEKLSKIFEYAFKNGDQSLCYRLLQRLDMITSQAEVLAIARENAFKALATKDDSQENISNSNNFKNTLKGIKKEITVIEEKPSHKQNEEPVQKGYKSSISNFKNTLKRCKNEIREEQTSLLGSNESATDFQKH